MKRKHSLPAMQESATRQIDELVSALERSTKALIAGDADETTPERDRWTRQVMKRIKMLSGLAPEPGSPLPAALAVSPRTTAPKSTPTSAAAAPSEANGQPPISTPASATIEKSRAQIRQEKRQAAKAEKERRKEFDQAMRRSETALSNWQRFRAAFPDLDPIKQLQEIKDRNFSSA